MNLSPARRKTLLAVVITVAVLWSSALVLGRMYVAFQDARHVPFVDFPSFFYAADAVFRSAVSPYLPSTLARYKELLGQQIWPFLYPPPTLLAFAPLGYLDYNIAAVSFFLANVIALIYVIWYLYTRFLQNISSPPLFYTGVVALSLYYPFAKTIINGQINFLVLILLLKAWEWAARDTRPVATGLALGAAILLKTYPVLLLLPFLARRNLPVLVSCGALLAAFVLAAAVVLPVEVWKQWLTEVAPSGGYARIPAGLFDPGAASNLSFNGALSRLIDSESLTRGVGYALAGLVTLVSLAVLWSIRGQDVRPYYDHAFSLLLMVMFLIAPLSWYHHLVFVLPCLLWVFSWYGEAPDEVSLPKGAMALFTAFVWLNLLFHFRPLTETYQPLTNLPTAGLLVFWIMIAYRAHRRTVPKAP